MLQDDFICTLYAAYISSGILFCCFSNSINRNRESDRTVLDLRKKSRTLRLYCKETEDAVKQMCSVKILSSYGLRRRAGRKLER